MPHIVTISRERHGKKGWKRHASYAFAAHTALVPLVAAELPKAALSLPIAFVRQGERYLPMAVLGIEPTTNLFVAPDGRWLGAYLPAALRSHPFLLARTESGELVLCVDEESGLVTEAGQGEPFFTDSGEPAEGLKQILEFLQQIERNREQTLLVCDTLKRLGLIQPWPIRLKMGEGERQIQGLFRIDEAVLNQLADESLLELRRVGGLPLVYCQLLAMQHIESLGGMAHLRLQSTLDQAAVRASIPFTLKDEDILRFDWDS
ncbi:MAG: SapC family protein [Thermochromatium sp.]